MHAPQKFKVNDAVAIRAEPVAPFEYWCVVASEESDGQRAYRIRSRTDERLIPEGGLIPLNDRLDGLLGTAGAEISDQARHGLLIALHLAQVEYRRNRRLASASRVQALEESIAKTITLLEEMQQYRGPGEGVDIALQAHAVGAGVVSVSPLPLKPNPFFKVYSGTIDGTAIIKMPELLRAWLDCVKATPTAPKHRARDLRIREIVRCAAEFSFQYSKEQPTGRVKDPFLRFAPEFFEWVTGSNPNSSLAGHIEAVVTELSEGRKKLSRPKTQT
jgi:hypothetical protein